MSIDFESLFNLPRDEAPAEQPPRRWGWPILAAALVIGLLLGARGLATAATDALWFASLGQTAVFRALVLMPLAVFGAALGLGALWLGANWLGAARRVAGTAAWPGQRAPAVARAGVNRLAVLVAIGVAGFIAVGAAAAWPEILLHLHRQSFGGAPDPIFGLDVGFYVFELPVIELAQALVSAWVLAALVGTLVIYAMGGAIELGRWVGGRGPGQLRRVREVRLRPIDLPGRVRAHLALLAALYALVLAWGQWLARYDLLYASRAGAVFYGPGYTDVNARLPVYTLTAALWIVVAVLFLFSARWGRWWLPIGAALVVVGLRLVAGEAYPGLVQAWRVKPDELRQESPYIAHNIAMTLAAYGLTEIETVDYLPESRVTPTHLAAHRPTLDAVRLWDWRVLLDFLNQKQSIRPYYTFRDVDVDRYATDSGQRQIELAAREIHPPGISNAGWVNRILEYTHGFGLALAPVNLVSPSGQPELWVEDLPPVVDPALGRTVEEPRVYFGEAGEGDYVIVGTRTDEFDYPSGSGNARNRYSGADGIVLSSWLRRLAFALRFGDSEILLSGAVTPESRLLLHRAIGARAHRLAPFLELDADPYLVVTESGRLVWIQDGYTVSDRYPYSQPLADAAPIGAGSARFSQANYIRNSVKVVTDAYDGTVTFYVVDDEDPLIRAWSAALPTLFKPVEAMPQDLVAHWRYPETLFRAQAVLYARYHMTQPDVFYNAEDLWARPNETRGQGDTQPIEPYYVTLQLRGEEQPEFVLMLPFTPAGKKNVVAWLAARSDPADYGKLVLYNFGKERQIDGPEQVESRIDTDTQISAQLTLWSQAGSGTIRGNLLVIPLGDALLYVEPLYLQAETNALPELVRVIVADGERVAMRDTLEQALAELMAGDGRGESADTSEAAPPPPSDTSTVAPGPRPTSAALGTPGEPLDVAGLVEIAQKQETLAREALAAGDWLRFGTAMAELQRALDLLAAQTSAVDAVPPDPSATPAPTP